MKYIVLSILLSSCFSWDRNKHIAKDSLNITPYKNCVIVGRQFDWDAKQTGAELITFRRGDTLWTESYMRSVFENFNIGDTIK